MLCAYLTWEDIREGQCGCALKEGEVWGNDPHPLLDFISLLLSLHSLLLSLSSGLLLLEGAMGMTTRFDAVHCIVGLSLPNRSWHWSGPIILFAVVGFVVGLSLLLVGLSAWVRDAYASFW